MFVELHMLQNFAPSCLNRDDTNTPKDCEFGGHRRARISSQCIKRAIRKHFKAAGLMDAEFLAERSKRLVGEVATLLAAKGRSQEAAANLVKKALASVKLSAEEKDETQYLLFLGRREISELANVVDRNWDALDSKAAPAGDAATGEKAGKPRTKKQQKADAKESLPPDVAKQVKAVFDGGKAADVALFGRMLADQADLNIDAACQVAHALSTNKVSMELDFFTAVDDLKSREEDSGAGMLGTVEFNSSCFYRYANIHFDQLATNLQKDDDLARKAVQAFLQASIQAIPTGKQNSMAAHNPPSLVFIVVRERGLWSLANAFEKPIAPSREFSLVQNSIRALDQYWAKLTRVYGMDGILTHQACLLDDDLELASLAKNRATSVSEVVETVMGLLRTPKEAA